MIRYAPVLSLLLVTSLHAQTLTPCGACTDSHLVGFSMPMAAPDTGRPRAIEYTNAYAVRLKIHEIASYTEIPLFIGEYVVGEKLLTDERNNTRTNANLRGPHSAIAAGLGALFAVNTITGVWNLVESRKEPKGRARRWIHSIAMLVADGGFLATAAAANGARRTDSGANLHRGLAIGSMGLATASTIMMWLWKD